IKFFRWATDRLEDRDGIICFISNNSFYSDNSFDGIRKRLTEEFSSMYLIDLGGDARESGGGNVFGIRVGVGITLLVRRREDKDTQREPANIYYYKINNIQRRAEKLAFLESLGSIGKIDQNEWQILKPDERYTWITRGLKPEFDTYLPI